MSKPVTSVAGRIEALELRRLVRPAQRRERPQRRGEPGVEHILVALDIVAGEAGAPLRIGGDIVALFRRDLLDLGVMGERVGDRVVLGLGDEDFSVRSVPGRNLMAPPDLPRDAPGLDVLHPVEERRFPLRRHEHGFALAHGGDRRLRQRLGVDVPLIGEKRLEHGAGAVAVRHDMRRRLDLVDEAAQPPVARRSVFLRAALRSMPCNAMPTSQVRR